MRCILHIFSYHCDKTPNKTNEGRFFFFLAHSSGTVVYPGGSMVPEASGNCLLSVTKEGETGSMVSL